MFATDTICFEPSSLLWLKLSQFPALFMLAIAMAESKIHKKAHTHLQSKKSQLNFLLWCQSIPTLCSISYTIYSQTGI